MPETDLLESALALAARGWPVFPLHGVDVSGRCTCGGAGCASPAKHPRTANGFKAATTDPARITRWWTDYPDSNIGLPTGAASGVVVVDCDTPEAVTAWEAEHQPWTVQVTTGKGAHYYYAHPGRPIGNKARIIAGVDIRGDGGYVVVPPSRHISGKDYAWEMDPGSTPLEPFPEALLEEALADAPKPPVTFTGVVDKGGRHETLLRWAGKLFANGHTPDEVLHMVLALNAQQLVPPIPEAEVRRTVRNIGQREFAKRPDLGTVSHEALTASVVADALADMDRDFSTFPGWFSPALHQMLGPCLPGTLTVIGARPGAGKTTLLSCQARHLAEQGHRVLYAGMEMPPAMLLRSIAAQALGYPQDAVLLNDWAALPKEARGRIGDWIGEFTEGIGRNLIFVPDHQLSPMSLVSWMKVARDTGLSTVIIDHLHEMDWGDDSPAAMSKAIRQIVNHAKDYGLTLIAAAQLKRGQYDVLEDYMVPPQSAIKACGGVEEVATAIAMLHRTLKEEAKEGDLNLVRRGQLPMESVIEDGTMSVYCAKHRIRPSRDQRTKLYVGRGRLFDTKMARDHHLWGMT